MTRYTLVVAALLLTTMSGTAAAAEYPEHKSKNAQKVFVVLNAIGMNNKTVRNLVGDVDSRVKDGYFNFAERKVTGGGKLKLRYNLGPRHSIDGPYLGSRLSTRRLELTYTPSDESRFEYTAARDRIMVNYRLKF